MAAGDGSAGGISAKNESNNVIDEQPEVAKRMKAELEKIIADGRTRGVE